MEYIIEEPKTSSGICYIPMSPEVSECFRRIISKRKKPKVEPMNPKTLQYIMGHSEIGVTLNTYTHMGFEDASAEMLAMEC